MKKPEPCKVLIVDDNSEMRDMVVERLTQESKLHVLTASSGNKAIALMRRHRSIRAILTDVVMLDGDGLKLLHWARRLRPNARVFFMTGNPLMKLERLRREGLDCLPDEVFIKPFKLQPVVAAILAACKEE